MRVTRKEDGELCHTHWDGRPRDDWDEVKRFLNENAQEVAVSFEIEILDETMAALLNQSIEQLLGSFVKNYYL